MEQNERIRLTMEHGATNAALAAGLKYIHGPETVTCFGMIRFHDQ